MSGKGNRILLTVVVLTAAVIAPLVVGGAYLGFYVGDATGYPRTVMAIAFSTAGFLASIFVLVRMIRWLVGRGQKSSS